MSLGTEFLQAMQDGLASKDSITVEKIITDDFEITTTFRTHSRQGFLDWVSSGGSPTTILDIELIYENDDIAVFYHGVDTFDLEGNARPGEVMCCGSKRNGKFYIWRVARAAGN